MPYDVPPYSNHQEADADAALRAQKAAAEAEKALQDQQLKAERDQRALEADQRAQDDRTTQGR